MVHGRPSSSGVGKASTYLPQRQRHAHILEVFGRKVQDDDPETAEDPEEVAPKNLLKS